MSFKAGSLGGVADSLVKHVIGNIINIIAIRYKAAKVAKVAKVAPG